MIGRSETMVAYRQRADGLKYTETRWVNEYGLCVYTSVGWPKWYEERVTSK